MRIDEELSGVVPSRDTVLTIGVFDGVHLGHKALLRRVTGGAARDSRSSAVLTFRNHPLTVLAPSARVRYITSVNERVHLLRGEGVEFVLPVTFDLEMSQFRAREFIGLLMDRLHMRRLVVGPDFAMGHRREGTVPVLQELGRLMGFELEVVEAQQAGDTPVRSTVVRQALESGDVALAGRLLGRNFSLPGSVVPGHGRGRGMGFPTANLAVDPARAIPAEGIYATWAHHAGQRIPAATSIGTRPTFETAGDRTVEAYMIDSRDELYGRHLELEFVERLRDEERFESAEALRHQMEKDVRQTLQALNLRDARPE